MPPKRTQSRVQKTPAGQVPVQTRAKTEHCALCCQKIVHNKEDVLFCTGKCNGPIHRYCAGVSVLQFEEMKVTSATATAPTPGSKRVPFLCLVCTQHAHKEEVHELKSIIAAMKFKMHDLQDTVQKLSVSVASCCNAGLPSSFAAATASNRGHAKHRKHADQFNRGGKGGVGSGGVVGRGEFEMQGDSCDGVTGVTSVTGLVRSGGCGAGADGRGGGHGSAGAGAGSGRGSGGSGGGRSGGEVRRRSHRFERGVPVENARKIWGTLKTTTCSVITSVIRKFTSKSLADSLMVKRKYKTSQDGSLKRWWYVVRGEKPDVERLEQKWEAIAIHTGWKLQAVFRFDGCDASAPLSSDVPATPTSDKQVSDTQPAVQHISSHNGDVFEPVQSLSANDKGSGGETVIVTDTSSPTSSF